MSLELNVAELKEELETGERNSEKAYRLNCVTMEIAYDVVEAQPGEGYVKKEIIPLFEKALEVIKISSAKGGFAKHMKDFVTCVKRRTDYLIEYSPILEVRKDSLVF